MLSQQHPPVQRPDLTAGRRGGVEVAPGNIVVGDEEDVVVVPAGRADTIVTAVEACAAKDVAVLLDAWEAAHRARTEEILRKERCGG
jgi:4-hydroxy-4-methyl-2-oxoglutarate aldolase